MKIKYKYINWLAAVLVLGLVSLTQAQTAMTFDKSFNPGTIGPGSAATL